MCAILTGTVSSGRVEMVFWNQTQDISTYTWADVSEFCLLTVWLGCGMAVTVQHTPGLVQPSKSPAFVADCTWMGCSFLAELCSAFEGNVYKPISPLLLKSVQKLWLFSSTLVHTGLLKTSLEFCDQLPGKIQPLCALPSKSDLILNRMLLHWFIVHIHINKILINKRPWVIVILQFDWITSLIEYGS